jgi:hypothetical protein
MRQLRFPREGSSSNELVSFLRQLVTELNQENEYAERGTANGWSYIRRGDGTYEAVGDFTVTIQSLSSSNGIYISDEIALPLPFASVAPVITGNTDGTALVIPIKSNTSALFILASFSPINAGARFNVRLHINSTVQGG